MICTYCPRQCGVDRSLHIGLCGVNGTIGVARAALHHWEEPCISGTQGSGTIFFTGCSMRCVFCQNSNISQNPEPTTYREVTHQKLLNIMQRLQTQGAHNINLVNPTHMMPLILPVLQTKPVSIPIVYNSGGYDTLHALQALDGFIDIYLPDIKYADNALAHTYSGVSDYVEYNRAAILAMYRQVGAPQLDESGIMQRGLMIRHLILPGHIPQTLDILSWIHDSLPSSVYVSIMSQYTPLHHAFDYPKIARTLTRREIDKVMNHIEVLGMENGYVQEPSSSGAEYVPEFDGSGVE